MPNYLISENSPYLLQHAENPVDWYPWGPEALEKARTEDKPIFLSIGYAACHWCHVMAHESFEDQTTAALMNEAFVNIKVDREERPDLDSIYMSAVVAMTGQGGWPMSVFLTPDGVPFFGGTYYPPQPRYGMPSFQEVLQAIQRAWKTERQRLLSASHELLQHIHSGSAVGRGRQKPNQAALDEAAMRLAQAYDWQHGGWGKAPKFPQPMALDFLLRRASRGDSMALQIAQDALDAMAKGGMYDVIGGGFARYSTDDQWLVPHFEKMLSDNAQLARIYLVGYLLTKKEHYRQVCTQTLDFIRSELMAKSENEHKGQPGFFSSLDADSEGHEGKYYVWSLAEIRAALTDSSEAYDGDFEFFKRAYGFSEQGNFEGTNVLQQIVSLADLATEFGLTEIEVGQRLERLHKRLYEIRSRRVRPNTDDKVLTAWNALALIVFAEAARYLKRADYLEIARANANFLLGEMVVDEKLHRSWRNGVAQHSAYLEDYAALILGLLALYQSDPNPRWYTCAEDLAREMQIHFADPTGGFFDTRDDQPDLIVRPKDLQDNATPSGNALAALALLQLSAYSGRGDWHEIAEEMLAGILDTAGRYPTAFAQWLSAVDFCLVQVQEVAILGADDSPARQALVETLWSSYRPDVLAAISEYPPASGSPALLADRPLLNGSPSAYVCQGFVCKIPVISPEGLLQQFTRKSFLTKPG